MTRKPSRIGEPVQVYLSEHERALLEKLAKRTAMSRSEVLCVALRRFAADLPGDTKPGSSLDFLIGCLDGAPDVPSDLAENHDEYLYGDPARAFKPFPRRGGEVSNDVIDQLRNDGEY